MTVTTFHTCLLHGGRRPGSALDCDDCRTALIKSFGEPIGDPVNDQVGETSREVSPGDARRCPWCPGHPVFGDTEHELSLIRDHVRNVHPDHFLGWAGMPEPQVREESGFDRNGPLSWVHQTTADTEPDDLGPGGMWIVSCVCGWRQDGHYARDTGEIVALRLARLLGRKHEEYPEES